MNRGLLLSGPLLQCSWVHELQKCCNPIDYGPGSGLNIRGGGWEGHQSPWITPAANLLRQICGELGVSGSLVFKIKKLQDDGQDLTPRPRG